MRKPTVKNKFNLTLNEIKRLEVINRHLLKKPLFWRNDVVHAWCISGNTAKNNDDHKFGCYSDFWLGIHDEDSKMRGKLKFNIYAYGGIMGYSFDNFFDENEIEDEHDLKVQEIFLKAINNLIDKRILCFPFTNSDWIKSDSLQWIRKTGLTTFEVINAFSDANGYVAYHGEVDLNDYSDEELLKEIKPFGYESIEAVSDIYGKSYDQIIAECISENAILGDDIILSASTEDELIEKLTEIYKI